MEREKFKIKVKKWDKFEIWIKRKKKKKNEKVEVKKWVNMMEAHVTLLLI